MSVESIPSELVPRPSISSISSISSAALVLTKVAVETIAWVSSVTVALLGTTGPAVSVRAVSKTDTRTLLSPMWMPRAEWLAWVVSFWAEPGASEVNHAVAQGPAALVTCGLGGLEVPEETEGGVPGIFLSSREEKR